MLAGVGELAMVNIFISVILSMAFLYWARDVLIPLALAVLLTFLLIPVVKRLQRLGLWRGPSVTLVVIPAGSLLGGIGWVVMLQLRNLANDLPRRSRSRWSCSNHPSSGSYRRCSSPWPTPAW